MCLSTSHGRFSWCRGVKGLTFQLAGPEVGLALGYMRVVIALSLPCHSFIKSAEALCDDSGAYPNLKQDTCITLSM